MGKRRRNPLPKREKHGMDLMKYYGNYGEDVLRYDGYHCQEIVWISSHIFVKRDRSINRFSPSQKGDTEVDL